MGAHGSQAASSGGWYTVRRQGDCCTEVLQRELSEVGEAGKMFNRVEFRCMIKREVGPFKQQGLLSDKCNQKVEKLITDNKN